MSWPAFFNTHFIAIMSCGMVAFAIYMSSVVYRSLLWFEDKRLERELKERLERG